MDRIERQEIYEGMLAQIAPESTASSALIFTHHVLSDQSDEEVASALCLLIDLLGTSRTPLPFYMAKLWAFANTDEGRAWFERFADDSDCSD
jgi:hypothetical protein